MAVTPQGGSAVNSSYVWDNANRLTSITQGTSVTFNYDNANRRTCLTLPNNVLVSYGYDTDSRVTSIGYGTGGSCSSRRPTWAR
jgi:YD repeat-containing protein